MLWLYQKYFTPPSLLQSLGKNRKCQLGIYKKRPKLDKIKKMVPVLACFARLSRKLNLLNTALWWNRFIFSPARIQPRGKRQNVRSQISPVTSKFIPKIHSNEIPESNIFPHTRKNDPEAWKTDFLMGFVLIKILKGTVEDPILNPFFAWTFFARFCLLRKSKKDTHVFQKKMTKISDYFLLLGSFFNKGEKYLLIFVCSIKFFYAF